MSIADIKHAEQLSRLRRHFAEGMEASRKMEGFLTATGLTSEHMTVVRIGIHSDKDQETALQWAIHNGASPSEMMAWHRLQNGDDVR